MTTHNSLVSGLLFGTIIPLAALGQNATGVHISVNDPRPLAAAALQLEQRTGVAINYEDISYAYPGDIVNNTAAIMQTKTPAQQAANPNLQFIVPRGGPLSLDSNEAVTGTTDVLQLLNQLTSASSASGYPGVYTATLSAGTLFIIPSQMRDSNGTWTQAAPLFDTAITFPSGLRSVGATLQLILQSVSQNSGTKVVLGMAPASLLIEGKATISANTEPARNVIAQLFSSLGPGKNTSNASTLAYRLLFDPKLKNYVLNIHSLLPGPPTSTSISRHKPTNPGPYAKKQ
jgi:hypothetical protein